MKLKKQLLCVLFLVFICSYVKILCALIGSDSMVQSFTSEQTLDAGDRVAKLAIIQGGLTLIGDGIFDSCFSFAGTLCLEDYVLTLSKDFIMANISSIGSVGDIVGNGHVLDLAKSVDCIPTLICTSTILSE